MGKKRQSNQQKLIAFGMAANGDQLNDAIETLQALRDARFPRVTAPAKSVRRRGPNKVKVATLTSANGADNDATTD